MPERQAFASMPGFETESVTRAELGALKWGRRKAWLVTLLVLAGAGVGGYYGWKDRQQLVAAAAKSEDGRRALEAAQKETVAKLEKQTADLAALEQKARPLLDKATAATATREANARFADDLKKQLAGDKEILVQASEDRVVVVVAAKALFAGEQIEPSISGYRVLFGLGKVLKTVAEDRQAVVTGHATDHKLPKNAPVPTAWELSGARAASVARFLIEDAGFAPKHVSATVTAPQRPGRPNAKLPAERVEIALAAAPAKS